MNDNVSWCQRKDCDGPYVATDPDQKYCSKGCSRRVQKRRQAAREEVANVLSQGVWKERAWKEDELDFVERQLTRDQANARDIRNQYAKADVAMTMAVQYRAAQRLTERITGSPLRSNQTFKEKQEAMAVAKEKVTVFVNMAERLGIDIYFWQIQTMRQWFYRDHMREIWAKRAEARRSETKTVVDGDGCSLIHIWQSAMPNGLILTPEAMRLVSVTMKDDFAVVETKERTER